LLSPNKCEYARTVGKLGESIAQNALGRAGLNFRHNEFNSPEPDFIIMKDESRIGLEVKTRTHDYLLTSRHVLDMISKFDQATEYLLKLVIIVGCFPTRISDEARDLLAKHGITLLSLREAIAKVMLCLSLMVNECASECASLMLTLSGLMVSIRNYLRGYYDRYRYSLYHYYSDSGSMSFAPDASRFSHYGYHSPADDLAGSFESSCF
jgi:hypothetical protein